MANNRYHNGRIYKIVSDSTDKIYIGSTCNPLCKRLSQHRSAHKKCKEGKKTNGIVKSFEIIESGNFDIVLLENYPCESKEQLHARERYWIEQNKAIAVNKYIPTRTYDEYYKENVETLKEKMKIYAINHKAEKRESDKKYYNKNIDDVKACHKEYYEKNKETINEKRREKIVCACGSTVRKAAILRHNKTAKHIALAKPDF